MQLIYDLLDSLPPQRRSVPLCIGEANVKPLLSDMAVRLCLWAHLCKFIQAIFSFANMTDEQRAAIIAAGEPEAELFSDGFQSPKFNIDGTEVDTSKSVRSCRVVD